MRARERVERIDSLEIIGETAEKRGGKLAQSRTPSRTRAIELEMEK